MLADPTKPCYDKVALLIGNRHYHHGRLKLNTPEADTQDLAGILRSADFKVVSLVNLTKQEMDQACAAIFLRDQIYSYCCPLFSGCGVLHISTREECVRTLLLCRAWV